MSDTERDYSDFDALTDDAPASGPVYAVNDDVLWSALLADSAPTRRSHNSHEDVPLVAQGTPVGAYTDSVVLASDSNGTAATTDHIPARARVSRATQHGAPARKLPMKRKSNIDSDSSHDDDYSDSDDSVDSLVSVEFDESDVSVASEVAPAKSKKKRHLDGRRLPVKGKNGFLSVEHSSVNQSRLDKSPILKVMGVSVGWQYIKGVKFITDGAKPKQALQCLN